MRLLDDRDNSLDILELPYMDQTMGMVIILPRVKTNTLLQVVAEGYQSLAAKKSAIAATPLIIMKHCPLSKHECMTSSSLLSIIATIIIIIIISHSFAN